ncbi:MAG TPA: hypothetical protein VGP70_18980 [Actinomadura sp.]|jgi:hypothetical protein|nr:hypothetical protein [Actinomadura sp.]
MEQHPKASTSGRRSSAHRRKKLFTYTLEAVAISLLIGSATVGPIDRQLNDHQDLIEGVVGTVSLVFAAEGMTRGLLLISALSLGFWALTRARGVVASEHRVDDPIFRPGLLWLDELQRSTSLTFSERDDGAVLSFIELLTSPGRYRSRVAEAIDLDGRDIKQRVSVEFTLPREALTSKSLYLPVLQPLKGELIDNFQLTDGKGNSLTNLSYEETTKLASTALMSMLMKALGQPSISTGERQTVLMRMLTKAFGDPSTDTGKRPPLDLDENTRLAALQLLEIIAKRGRIQSVHVACKVDYILGQLTALKPDDRDRLRRYALSLSASYPIVAVLPAELAVGNRVLVKYERTFIPSSENKGKPFKGEFRLGFGLRPNQIAVPTELALSASSYHLRINGPADKYVLGQYFECRNCGRLATRGLRGTKEAVKGCFHDSGENPQGSPNGDYHFRLRRKRGQNYVHLYMRGYADAAHPLRGFQVRVRFKETPPGSRANAAVTALATTVLIGVVGHLLSRPPTSVTLTAFPALALALPAIAASWFGFAADNAKLMGSSLLARLSLICSGVLALSALAFYLLRSPAATATPPGTTAGHMGDPASTLGLPLSILGITGNLWPILFCLSATNFIYVSWRYALKVYYYKFLIQKEDIESREYSLPF